MIEATKRNRLILILLISISLIFAETSASASTSPHQTPNSCTSSSQTSSPNHDSSSTSNLAFLNDLKSKYSHQPTFLQSVQEMANSLQHLFHHPDPTLAQFYQRAFLTMAEPERTISFRVPWRDDNNILQINTGWRVEFSSALGPYKGGLRFHPTVDEGVLKFLGFEQIFKNALTGLPLGGGKGGSNFDPKHKSEAEIQRFCQSFMIELHRYLHPSTDVPAGDIGVGGREIGYLTGTYKRIVNQHGTGILTGKSINIGGSHFRPEATGFGLVYIAKLAIEDGAPTRTKSAAKNKSLKGTHCAISGSGNVAQYAAQKLLEYDAKVLTMSDSNGVLYFKDGMTQQDWNIIVQAKQVDRVRLSTIESQVSGIYMADTSPWDMNMDNNNDMIHYDYAFPCATQNEINKEAAEQMVQNGLKGLFEGANLPTQIDAQKVLQQHHSHVIYIPGKAANAGGVGVSGFEMMQNAQKMQWKAETVDAKLQDLMAGIYKQLVDGAVAAKSPDMNGDGSLEMGANHAGFLKVVDAMKDLGWL